MKIYERTISGITVFDLEGSFVLGGEGEFRKRVAAYIDDEGRKLIINLAKVGYMDSSGLGELISCFTQMQQVTGNMKLLHLNHRLHQLLVITKLITVFETFDSESAAVSSFTPALNSAIQSPASQSRQM